MLYAMTGTLVPQRPALWILCVVWIAASAGEKLLFEMKHEKKTMVWVNVILLASAGGSESCEVSHNGLLL